MSDDQQIDSPASATVPIREQLKIVVVGHVDHGKSTLIGRLFYDTDSLPEGRYEQIREQCQRRGMPFEWAFLMDSLQAERDQGITIDTTQICFRAGKRDYMIIDAPGHKEFLKNMVSGAASCDSALLVIDANRGVGEQSKRHGYLLHLLGVDQVAVAINKMDLEHYSRERFEQVKREYLAYLSALGVLPTHVIPISAMQGDCMVGPSENMPWYEGPSIIEALEDFGPRPMPYDLPLRFPVQDVYKFDERRIIVGRIESGILRVGDEILFSPSNKVARVASFEVWHGFKAENPDKRQAVATESVGITLDQQIFVERGDIISHNTDAPVLTNMFRARVFWLGDTPLQAGNRYRLKMNTAEYQVEVAKIETVIDTNNLSHSDAHRVEKNGVAEINIQLRGLAAADQFSLNPVTGRFVLMDGYTIAGGGIIDLEGFADQRRRITVKSTNLHPTEARIDPDQRSISNGHLGGVLWFTGLPSSGKTTLALELEQRLFARGYQVFVLDGDNVRSRLNSDLGFEPQDRTENIRRVGEVAALFAEAGMIVIAAFISPYHADREQARLAAGDRFHCVYIESDVETCESRDPYGLWQRVRQGKIQNFTGVDAPYEVPVNPELVVNTRDWTIEECVEHLLSYVKSHLIEPVAQVSQAV
jgi:bifunctional enzyme CysN/CysC